MFGDERIGIVGKPLQFWEEAVVFTVAHSDNGVATQAR